ncbi:hypothetical protein OsJ_10036 [Oryza sativa Japonica Group]|uniref:Uncharacterized protein n=2 Tax=Oryza sativa subsp. japonica TaxID=39947 RepID=A0A9K3Y891_ORYSJ|nr:Hypothetical protein [Oryza sativa Japonica Group]ABF94808.1 hypothetical protein LOC_Os03g13020 [Oryza sativa Japonica Group]EAZ26170.1 hypothetical protein OsJ_10036 [Oryza sativa Japonica Group]
METRRLPLRTAAYRPLALPAPWSGVGMRRRWLGNGAGVAAARPGKGGDDGSSDVRGREGGRTEHARQRMRVAWADGWVDGSRKGLTSGLTDPTCERREERLPFCPTTGWTLFQRASRFGRCSKKCPEVDAVPKHVQARFGVPMPPCGEAPSSTLLSSGPMLVQGSGKVLPCPPFTSTLGDCSSRLPASVSTTSVICRLPQLTSKALESGEDAAAFCLHAGRLQPLSTFWLSHAGTITHSCRLVLRRLSAPLGS